jgi:hypothetical protein
MACRSDFTTTKTRLAGVIFASLITPCGRVPVLCNLPVGAHGDGAPKGQTSPEPLRRQDCNGQAT